MEYIMIFIVAVFVNNVVLSQFLGICPFLGVSKKVETSIGMGAAVTFVLAISTIVTYLIQKFVYTYVDINRQYLSKVKNLKTLMSVIPGDDALLYDFVTYAKQNGIPARWYYIGQSRQLLLRQLRALIVRDVLGDEEFYRYYNQFDKTIKTALKAFESGKAEYPIKVEIEGNAHFK